jgi:hypothetical protein
LRDEASEIRESVETLAGGREHETNVLNTAALSTVSTLSTLSIGSRDSGVSEGRKSKPAARSKRRLSRRDGTNISIQPEEVFPDSAIRGLIDEWIVPMLVEQFIDSRMVRQSQEEKETP